MTVEDPSAPPAVADPFAGAAGHRAFALVCFASLFTALASMWLSPSLPSPLGVQIGLAAGAVFGLAMAWEARPGGYMSPANARLMRTGGRSFMLRHVWMRLPLMAGFVFALVYATLAYGLGGIVTAAVGQPASRTLTITGVNGGGRSSCRHFEVREMSFVLGRAFCASSDLLAQAQPGRALILQGKASPLGFNVERMTLGPPVAAGPP